MIIFGKGPLGREELWLYLSLYRRLPLLSVLSKKPMKWEMYEYVYSTCMYILYTKGQWIIITQWMINQSIIFLIDHWRVTLSQN